MKNLFTLSFKKWIHFLGMATLTVLSACNPMGDNKVEVLTQGALDPVEFYVEGGSEHGEFLVGADASYFNLHVTNNNAFRITKMNLDVDPFSSAAMKFATNSDGKSISPGAGGTCGTTLASGKSCIYRVEYSPTFSGELTQKFKFTYSNLINVEEEEAEINLLAGEAANLGFVSEIINYDYGYMERTEPEKITKKLTVINNGGLTARNMKFGVLYSHNSDAFTIKENTCTTELPAGETCSFIVDYIPMNYGPGAPDGDEEQTYTCNPRFDYIRDPEGGKGALTAYFTALSTTIEGRILSSGITQLEFTELTVGNRETKAVKIQNYGYKEAIVHNVEVYDAADNKVATCIKVGSMAELVCQDPNTVSSAGSQLPLSTLPLRISDTTGCINEFDSLDYTFDAGVLSDPSLFQLAGKTNTKVGDSCFLDITFWPSVTHTTNGNINDYKLRFKFDSTWKNEKVIYGDDNTYDSQFLLTDASWLSAAQMQVDEYRYGAKDDYVRETGTASTVYLYDLGRIALISNSAYKQATKITFKNVGYTDAEVLSVTDGKTTPNVLTESTVDLNDYYLSTGHVGCGIVSAIGGDCNIRFNLAPMASSLSGTAAENEENGNMFDVTDPYPDQYKKFILTYKDGTTYNDDGSLRADRVVEVWARALLVRKGFLVFSSTDPDQGTKMSAYGDSVAFHHVILKNAGTGGIPVIEKIDQYSLSGTSAKSGNSPYPYEIVDRPGTGGEAGADKDCYELLVDEATPVTPVTPGTNASSILDAGETCSLTIKMRLRGNDVVYNNWYSLYAAYDNWHRFFDSDYQGMHELWEERYYNAGNQIVSFRYYDGDGISDMANGYTPDEEGYGNFYDISGGLDGFYYLRFAAREPAKLYPESPLPSYSSSICRDVMMLPGYTVPAHEWGNPLSPVNVPEVCRDYSEGKSDSPVTERKAIENHVKSNYSGYDYIFHAGYFPAGGTYDLSFILSEDGPATQAIHNYSGDTGVIDWINPWGNPLTNFSARTLKFEFKPTLAGSYSTDLVVTYNNGERILDDEATFAYSNQNVTFRIRIIAEAINAGMDNIAMDVQDYTVTYDSGTETLDDTTTKGAPYNVNLHYRSSDMAGNGINFYGIRESVVYDKKVLTFTNNGANTLSNFQFNFKQGINSGSFGAPAGRGMSIDQNNCMDITLNPTDSCDVTIHFLASKDEAATSTVYGTVVYNMGGIQFGMKNFEMIFNAADPAILETAPKIATKIIKDENNLNIKSIPLALGLYADSGHPVVNSFPTDRFSKNNVNIKNISAEKASFLAQWEAVNGATPLPGGSWIEIYNTGGVVVEANRACFFGDDEGDAGVPDEEKGFNDSSSNACRMNFHIDLDDTYFGETLDTSKTYFKLLFYNNKRSSTSEMLFHFTGFIEPNPSNMSNTDIANVETDSDGNLYFEWDSAVAGNSSWGSIIGYNVYAATTQVSLNDIFKASSPEFTTNEYITLNGLVPGRYYYLKVVAVRQSPSGKQYISDIDSPIKSVIIPPEGYVYNYDQKILFSKNYSSEGGPDLKDEGAGVCASDIVTLSQNGSIKNKPMKLIDTDIWNLIESDPSYSDYSIDTTPHWMSDNPVDISFIFPDFSCSETSGDDGGSNFYTKDCSDCSCNTLSIVKGGDGQFLPPGSTIYVDGGAMSAFFRCYIDQ